MKSWILMSFVIGSVVGAMALMLLATAVTDNFGSDGQCEVEQKTDTTKHTMLRLGSEEKARTIEKYR